jgi:hypothetical protein
MLAVQLLSVLTVVDPMKDWPSPLPDASQLWLEKNSMIKLVLAAEFSEPVIVVVLPELMAEVNTG